MEHKFTHLNKTKEITLTPEERAYLRAHMAHVVATPVGIVEPLFKRGVQHGLRIALSSFLFIVFAGGSISALASNAYPGDLLYAVKTEINENIKAAFLKTPEEKVAFRKGLVENRINEIKTLAETKTLTPEKQKKAQKALDQNVKDLSKELTALSDKAPNTALSVTANLEENLIANKEAIESTLITPTATASEEHQIAATEALKTVDGTLQKVSEQEVKILSKEIDNITKEATKTDTSTDRTQSNTITNPNTDPIKTSPTPVEP